MENLPIIIASISLVLTLLTFYLTQLRPAKIDILIGPEIRIYYADYPNNSTGLYIPMSFVNSSASLGTIYKCAISINRNDSKKKRYFMLWREFSKIGGDGNWTFDSQAHSFAVPGKSSISKTAWYIWLSGSSPKFHFKEGDYSLIVHAWMGTQKKPKNYSFGFNISSEEESMMNSRLKEESKKTLSIILNKQMGENKSLTEHESKVLLGT
ncbi:MAG: hypothetical protein AAGB24_03235 [Bacteroidota bacterium]